MITLYKICFTAKCRKCGKEEDYHRRVVGEDVEVEAHEHLESEGWVDSVCPPCVEIEFKTK